MRYNADCSNIRCSAGKGIPGCTPKFTPMGCRVYAVHSAHCCGGISEENKQQKICLKFKT